MISVTEADNSITMLMKQTTELQSKAMQMFNQQTQSMITYDKNGNLTKAVIKGVQYQYEYDAEDRLITVKDSSGNKIASYTYDAEGNRSTKTTYSNNNPVNTTTYHYYNGELLYETLNTDPANVIHALYIRTPAGAIEAVSLNYVVDSSSNTFYYYHYNAHGDVIAVTKTDSSDPTNITGKIYRQYTYDPYGNIISAKDGSGNVIDINNDSGFDDSYLYAGYRYDKESGLYFLNARYYAPGLGRFLTKDSEIDTANAKSLNSYVYCQDDPVNLADPDGDTPVMTDDAGHYVYSNGRTYTNKAEVRRADKQVKAIKKQQEQQRKKQELAKKESINTGLGDASRLTTAHKGIISMIGAAADIGDEGARALGIYGAVFTLPFTAYATLTDPVMKGWQKALVLSATCALIGATFAFSAPAAIIGFAIAGYIIPNTMSNVFDWYDKKQEGDDENLNVLGAMFWH